MSTGHGVDGVGSEDFGGSDYHDPVREAAVVYEAGLRLRERCSRVLEDGIRRRLAEALREMPGVSFELHKASFDVERGGAARLQAELDRPRCDR